MATLSRALLDIDQVHHFANFSCTLSDDDTPVPREQVLNRDVRMAGGRNRHLAVLPSICLSFQVTIVVSGYASLARGAMACRLTGPEGRSVARSISG